MNTSSATIPWDATSEEILNLVRRGLDLLALADYSGFFELFGYTSADDPTADTVRKSIENYRSPEYFPGVTEFAVTDWRTATGGNPDPQCGVNWYKPKPMSLRGAVTYDLPINGAWSDLTADFILLSGETLQSDIFLDLEEIYSLAQRRRYSEE